MFFINFLILLRATDKRMLIYVLKILSEFYFICLYMINWENMFLRNILLCSEFYSFIYIYRHINKLLILFLLYYFIMIVLNLIFK